MIATTVLRTKQERPTLTKFWFLGVLILANCLLLTPDGSFLRVVGAMTLFLLPGLIWAERFGLGDDWLIRAAVGLGLGYAFIVIFGLMLHYLPGHIPLWMILLVLNALALSPVFIQSFWTNKSSSTLSIHQFSRIYLLLLAILLAGAFFRFSGLGYSEFQGDETKPMVSAARALEGDEEALFTNRKKGPGEILLPMMLWRLTGTINELIARTPFALTGVLSVLTIYLIASRLLGDSVGLVAAGLLAFNGFMVGFSRIVQYQPLVIWMSLLALLCGWEWRRSGLVRWGVLMGLFLGVGVLFHYDTLLIVPALVYVMVSKPKFRRGDFKAVAAAVIIMLAVVILFFVPFTDNPQATFTANYVGGRIGKSLINNNLFEFYHYTIFYNSFYYVVITGLLLLGLLAWVVKGIKRVPVVRYLVVAGVVVSVIYLSVSPSAFYIPGLDIDLAFLLFGLLFLGAFFSPASTVGQKVIIVWLATAFLGYNFIVTDPRTHFYTISPAWVMLAAVAIVWLWDQLVSINFYVPVVAGFLLAILFGGYLYFAFLRQDVEFYEDWPDSHPVFYWTPYTTKPRHHFGFVHKYGWKAVGGLYASDQLEGRYQTNSGSGIDRWYARQVLWGCSCCQPKDYYLAFNYKEIDDGAFADYKAVGDLTLPTNGKGIAVYSSKPDPTPLPAIPVDELYRAFDRTAKPAVYVPPSGERHAVDANLADFFELVGHELIAPKLHPGEEMAVILYWQRSENYTPINFNTFVHLEDSEGNIGGQSNDGPVCGQKLTSTWAEAEIIADAHIIPINPHTPPGEYVISAGMYLPDENFRLPVLDDKGQPIAESVILGTVTIE